MSSLNRQVGGNHYKGLKYQPVEFASKMRLNFVQGSILKYVSRFPFKNGKQDLEKGAHFCELGVDTRPMNVALSDSREIAKYCKLNGFDKDMELLIIDIIAQFWLGCSNKIFKLSEKHYGGNNHAQEETH